jgi:hypothetical protein
LSSIDEKNMNEVHDKLSLATLPNDSSDVVASFQTAKQQWKDASLYRGG